jgi:N-acetylglutamate synthase-like GNAT family acetyltransferase
MKTDYIDVAKSKDLSHVYNEQLRDTPFYYPVSPDEFEDGIQNRINQKDTTKLHSEKIIIGEENGSICGFAHVSIGDAMQYGQIKSGGIIHFLAYQSGHRPIGQAILEECERYLKSFDVPQIWAFLNASNYRFYHLGFGYLSDKIGHVYGLFHMNKYDIDIGEVFMSYPEYNVSEPVLNDKYINVTVEHKPGQGVLPNLHIQASRNENDIGECYTASVGEFYRASEAQDWFFTKWLGIEEEDQGKGLGRYLLQRTLWEMRKIGYRNAVISTNITNYRAQLFYTNFGYQVVDTAYGLVKSF